MICIIIRPEPILLLFFFPAILLFLTYFAQYFAHYLAMFLLIIGFFLVYLQLLSMHDCCIKVIHNMVTALLEHFNLLGVFPKAYVPVCDYSSRVSPSLQCKIDQVTVLRHPFFQFFTYISGILLFAFSLLFFKKLCR